MRFSIRFWLGISAFLLLFGGTAHGQTVLCVDESATGNNNGGCWTDAYVHLQDALDEAEANPGTDYEIRVATGTYYPDEDDLANDGVNDGSESSDHTADSKDEYFTLSRDGVTLLGGYPSGGGTRDPQTNGTTLSGDLEQNDVPWAPNTDSDDNVLSPTRFDHLIGENARHVLFLDGENGDDITTATVIDGFTITAGAPLDSGVSDNSGGGVFCDAQTSGNTCNPVLQQLKFENNHALRAGGAIINAGFEGTASPTLRNVTFFQNSADLGGGVFNSGINGGTASPDLVNVLFSENYAPADGGAVYNNAGSGETSPVVINGTIVRNRTDGDGGGMFNDTGGGTAAPTIQNTILWGNTASGAFNQLSNDGASPSISNSIVEGSGGSANWDASLGTDNGNNLDRDPQLEYTLLPKGGDNTLATGDDGIRVLPGSPALDSGDNAALPNDTYDLDDDGNTTETLPLAIAENSRVSNSTVDIGAYEGVTSDVARLLYVDETASGDSTGLSWGNGFQLLSKGLRHGTGDDVIAVATGTYVPRKQRLRTDVRSSTFEIEGWQDGLEVYGGYGGGETIALGDLKLDQRDLQANEVTLSGDLGTVDDPSDNAYHVVYLDGTAGGTITSSTVLDGVTVTDGNTAASGDATLDASEAGGGLYCNGSGAGNECSALLRNLWIRNNAAVAGGGLFNDGSNSGTASPTVLNSIFAGNTAENGSQSGTRFRSGGAIFDDGNGGTTSPTLTNTTIAGNSAVDGGGLANDGRNSGTAAPNLTNSILWDNTASNSANQILNDNATPSVSYSIVEGSGGSSSWDSALGTDDGGNLDENPQFTDGDGPDDTYGTADDDLRLKGPGSGTPSPAIDAGDNTGISLDKAFGGNDRKVDVGSITDTGNGTSPIVDMGSYESVGDALPVELAFLKGRLTEDAVLLRWKTLSEQNNAEFQVQRQSETGNWTLVGQVDGQGTTDTPQDYRFRDQNLPYKAETLTYRLKQVDTDGTTSFSDPVSIGLSSVAALQLRAPYPNPASQQLTVQYAVPDQASPATTVSLRLYDALGREVRTVKRESRGGRHSQTLDVSGLSSGTYILRLSTGTESTSTRVTIVQ